MKGDQQFQNAKFRHKVYILSSINYLQKRNLNSETGVFFKQVCKVGYLLRLRGKNPYVKMKIRDTRARPEDHCSTRE